MTKSPASALSYRGETGTSGPSPGNAASMGARTCGGTTKARSYCDGRAVHRAEEPVRQAGEVRLEAREQLNASFLARIGEKLGHPAADGGQRHLFGRCEHDPRLATRASVAFGKLHRHAEGGRRATVGQRGDDDGDGSADEVSRRVRRGLRAGRIPEGVRVRVLRDAAQGQTWGGDHGVRFYELAADRYAGAGYALHDAGSYLHTVGAERDAPGLPRDVFQENGYGAGEVLDGRVALEEEYLDLAAGGAPQLAGGGQAPGSSSYDSHAGHRLSPGLACGDGLP